MWLRVEQFFSQQSLFQCRWILLRFTLFSIKHKNVFFSLPFSKLFSLVLLRFHGIYSFIIVRFIIYFSCLPDKGVLGKKHEPITIALNKTFLVSALYNGFGMQILFALVERSLTKPILQRHLPGLLQTPFTHGSGQCGLHL